MIYTTYLANVKNLPNNENTEKILVIRWKPRNTIDLNKYNLQWWPQLAPSELILSKYKDGNIDWQQYRKMFIEDTNNNKMLQDALEQIVKLDDNNKEIFLICYEKNDLECHRSILRQILKEKYNKDSKEF